MSTMADLLKQLGNIAPHRIRMHPAPGTATVKDVIEIEARENRLFELVDGILVEKVMGFHESRLAAYLIHVLQNHVLPRNLGVVTGSDGTMEIIADLVRIPDVAFIAWASLPNAQLPPAPVPKIAPDLAVEVLSASNTKEEMERKRREYFEAGVRVAWFVDPVARTVAVYTSPQDSTLLHESDTLTGEPALPGFTLPLRELFAELDRRGNA